MARNTYKTSGNAYIAASVLSFIAFLTVSWSIEKESEDRCSELGGVLLEGVDRYVCARVEVLNVGDD